MESISSVLVVDDTIESLKMLTTVLQKENYKVRPATSGQVALEASKKNPPDLVILDIRMPDMDGYQVCDLLRKDPATACVPIIFISALEEEIDKVKAFAVGGQDYITKPFNLSEIKARVKTHIAAKRYQDQMTQQIYAAQSKIEDLNIELIETQRELLFTLCEICEGRSHETGQHTHRVAQYTALLASLSGRSSDEVDRLMLAAPLHDIGKLAIPDAILNKESALTPDERKTMQNHASLGYKMLKSSDRALIKTAAVIAHEHHERWDGTGYPNRLSGNKISFGGRAVAVADVFDALVCERCYKKAWSLDDAVGYMKSQSGHHFDPDLINLLLSNLEEFDQIRKDYRD